MSEMVERVAKAICEASGRGWESLLGGDETEIRQRKYRNYARAAIEAMRDIPKPLLEASAGEDCHIDPLAGIYIDQWEAVIDAILNEKPHNAGTA